MSENASETTLLFDQISTNLYRFTFLPIIVVGLIDHLFNIILFTRPNLLSNSCCNYCLASSFASIIQILFGQLFRYLTGGYHVALPVVWWCRVRIFFLYTAYLVSTILVTFASADRYASSCSQLKYRRWATVKITPRVVPIALLITGLCQSHIVALFDLDGNRDNECWARKGTSYRLGFDIAFLINHGLIFPSLLLTFGFLTLYNIRRKRCYQQYNITSLVGHHRIRDFQCMTLVQTVCIILFTLPFAIYKLQRTIIRTDWKTPEEIAWERFTMCLVRLLWFFS